MAAPRPASSTVSDDAVIAATREWLTKAVIGLNLCPFASRVVSANQLGIRVSRARDSLDLLVDVHTALEQLSQEAASALETSLLVMPDALSDFLDFNDFLGDAQDLLERLDLEGVIQIASFHPDYQFADVPAQDITNFTNRAPYPCLHFLREESLSQAIDAFGDTESIIERNQQTMRSLGLAGWKRLFTPPEKA